MILGYTPISFSFQAPKCVIKARDPCLHRLSVAATGFLLPMGIHVPEGALVTQPILESTSTSRDILEGMPKVGFLSKYTLGEAASSQPSREEKDEEEEELKEVVDVFDLDNLYEVFD